MANVACAGVLTTDILEIYPNDLSKLSAGYAVHHAMPTAAGRFTAVLSVPPVQVLSAYSIPVAVYAVNR